MLLAIAVVAGATAVNPLLTSVTTFCTGVNNFEISENALGTLSVINENIFPKASEIVIKGSLNLIKAL